MRWKVLAVGLAAASAAGVSASPAAADSSCASDGVATLCVTAKESQDAQALSYQITQTDGPGTYLLYYVDRETGEASNPRTIGPLAYQAVVSGNLFARVSHCYDVHLDGTPGSSLVLTPTCR